MQVCFASHNENKVKEMNAIMPEGISILGLKDLEIVEDIVETGKTLEENSQIKATYVFERHNMPVFADDSGLLVNALNGEPGVYSARYAGAERNDDKNMNRLLERLESHSDRTAEFQTVITYIDQKGKITQFKGVVEGTITSEKRGDNGFGYDPIFKPSTHNETFAELSQEIKNQISHRAKAVQQLVEHLHQQHD